MNVRCPSCETLYRVDPSKVPEQGVQARCAECTAVISVVHWPDHQLVGVPSEAANDAVGTDTFMPPPLVAADQIVDSIDGPTEQLDGYSPVEDGLISVNYGADILDEPATIETPSSILPHEFVDAELPPLPDAPVVEDDLTLPDETPPMEMVESVPAFEPTVPGVPLAPDVFVADDDIPPSRFVADDIPPSSEVTSQVEAVEDYIPPLDDLPPVPDLSAGMEPADIEIPAPELRPTQPPALEILPRADASPHAQPRRYTRPFLRPPEAAAPSPPPAPAGPMRPTAPVFRPTPGMPIKTPPAPEPTLPVDTAPAPFAPESLPPVETPSAPRPASEPTGHVPVQDFQPEARVAAEPKPRRPVNPFLSKDPKQKARRLARALVSDMIVYQPQKRQDALAAGTLKEAFNEEIKKSWEEYVDQIGNELATQTNFFKEALNEILAGGDEIF